MSVPPDEEPEDPEADGIDVRELRLLGRFLRRYFRPYSQLGLGLAAALLAETAFNIGFPLAARHLVDEGLVRRDHRALIGALIFLAVAAPAVSLLGLLCDYLAARIASGMIVDIRRSLFDHLQALPLAFSARASSGAILSRFSGDVVGLEGALVSLLPWLVLPALEVAYSTALMFWFSGWLGLIGLVVFPVILWGPRLFATRALALAHEKRRCEAELMNVVQENIGARPVVKAFGLEGYAHDQMARCGARWSRIAFRFNFLSSLVERSATTGVYVLHLVIFGLGAYWVYIDRLSLGRFIAFEGLFLSIGESLTYLTQCVPILAQAAGGARHLDEIFAEEPSVVDAADAVALPRFAGEIAFESVGFEYSPGSFRLEDLRLRVPRGSRMALVGGSGSGKSTILTLLLRFYDPTAGAILVDGRDLRGVTQASWRSQVGVVFQDSILFRASIRENIRLGNPGASDRQVEAAARAAEIHDFVVSLPDGYETAVGERGGQLSGGQRQRIAIARALVRDPSILILDEATSALDHDTEAALLATLRTITRGRTVIQVTHRLAGAIDPDHVVLLDRGRVAEQGAPRDLIERGGLYAGLLRRSRETNDSAHR